jgi:hypothetical protein
MGYVIHHGAVRAIRDRLRQTYELSIRLDNVASTNVDLAGPAGELVDQLLREIEGASRLTPGLTRKVEGDTGPTIPERLGKLRDGLTPASASDIAAAAPHRPHAGLLEPHRGHTGMSRALTIVTAVPTPHTRAMELHAEARQAAAEHMAEAMEAAERAAELLAQVSDGGPLYHAGIKDISRRLAAKIRNDLESVAAIAARPQP